MEPFMTRAPCIGLAGIGLLLAATLPARAGTVSCSDFVLGYNGQAKKKTCTVEDTSTGNLESESKTFEASDHDYTLWLTYHHAGLRTYIPSRSVQELLGGSNFSQVEPWGESQNIQGFDVLAFDGVPSGEQYKITCAIFARYYGNPGNYEFDAGPGTRNALIGIYCADPGYLTAEQRQAGFYNVVGQVIGKLRLPPPAD